MMGDATLVVMQELSIGELARASGLTVKRLRHYHDTGVLTAARIDADSGYRWYHPDQVADAVLIRRLRETGVPLSEVAEIVGSPERRRERVIDALRRTRSELERARDRVDEAAHLLQSLPEVPLAIRRIPDQWVCAAAAELSLAECAAWFDETFPRLYAAAGVPLGPCGASYGTAFFEDGRGPVRALVPTAAGTPGAEPLPGGVFAVAVHDGAYENARTTYAAMAAQLHSGTVGEFRTLPGAAMREHYLIGPTETPEPHRWRSEICWPVTTTD